MELEQAWKLPNGLVVVHHPRHERTCGSSHFWYCSKCGKRYASVASYKDSKMQIWKAHPGMCLDCEGTIYQIPGTLECLDFVGDKDIDECVPRWQLLCELNFLSSPAHPHNKKDPLDDFLAA